MNEGESGMGLVGSLYLLRDFGLQLGGPRFELRDARVGSEGFSHALQHRVDRLLDCANRCFLVRGYWLFVFRFLRSLGRYVGGGSGCRADAARSRWTRRCEPRAAAVLKGRRQTSHLKSRAWGADSASVSASA
ncbi:hypothetical protein [Streptomyces virginiae]|uniref:hypothetical protein n=1 Tax=Streptomyces virginiae TaxID=1961 RepID=UPI003686C501